MQHVRVCAYLYGHAIKILYLVSVFDKPLIYPMVTIRRVHNDYYPILQSFDTDREHNLLKLFFVDPFLGLVNDKRSNALNRFKLCRLITT